MKKTKRAYHFLKACVFAFLVCVSLVNGNLVQGTAAHYDGMWTFLDGSIYEHKYVIELTWDYSDVTGAGLSHFDLDLSPTLLCDYSLFDLEGDSTGNIRFENPLSYTMEVDTDGDNIPDTPMTYYYTFSDGAAAAIDGQSVSPGEDGTGVSYPTVWGGITDASQNVDARIIRYEQPLIDLMGLDPNPPESYDPGNIGQGTFWFYSHFGPIDATAGVTLKAGENLVDGAVTGELPYCVPEPATLALLGLGGLLLRRRR